MSGLFDDRFEQAGPAAVPQPLDIRATLADAADFPIDALPPVLRDAILAIEAMAQVPLALAAQSILAAASLGAQGFINVETITGQSVPASLFFLSIASSGDRKSTSDKFAILPIKDREEELSGTYEARKLAYAIDEAAYRAATNSAKSGLKDREKIREALERVGRPPVPPIQPLLTCDEPTGPGMQRLFAEAMPALGLFSDEGATFLGGWAMQEENQASTGGMLSKLWDGSPIKRIRADKEGGTSILHNRRLSVHLMIQPDLAGKLLGNKAVRSQGLLSRVLPVAPKSLKGKRFWKEPTEAHRVDLRRYQAHLGKLLATEFRFMDPITRRLDLDLVRLTPEAKARLILFSDHCEGCMGPGGKYEQIADFAAKMAENAVRVAAVVSFFRNGPELVAKGLSERAINAGVALMEFYASEAARLYGAPSMDDDTANAVALIEWIRKRGYAQVGLRYLNRSGPVQTRAAGTLKRAVEVLVEHRHLVKIPSGAVLDLDGKSKHYTEAYNVVPLEAA
jgi:hypothetical protein